jgi:homopolymeric O-antigen transport system permease protein
MFTRMFRELYDYRELLFALTSRDIRVKYKQAVLGVAWVFLLPTLAILSGVLFRLAMAIFSGQPLRLDDVVGVMVKSIPWLLFAAVVRGAATSLVGNVNLMTQIYFPRQVLPMSRVLSALFDFAVSLVGVIVLFVILELGFAGDKSTFVWSFNMLWVPVMLILLVAMATGMSMFLASINVFFRDVQYVVQLVLQYGIFFSLVYFTYQELGRWGWLMLLNPVSPPLEVIRTALLDGRVDPFLWPWLGYSALVTVLCVGLGMLVFDRAEGLFADYA